MSVPAALAVTRRGSRARARRGTGKLVAGGALLTVFVLAALFPQLYTGADPLEQDLLNRLAKPGDGHLLGTDSLGRDEFARIVYATRVDLRVGVLGALLPMLIGAAVGIVAAFGGRVLDTALMRLADVVLSFPILIFFLVLVGLIGPGDGFWFLGPGEATIVLGFALIGWVVYARLMRTQIQRVMGLGYIEAARAGGLSRRRIIVHHVLPNAASQIIVYVFVDIGLAILSLSALSYLGLGVPGPTPEWGQMIAESRTLLQTNWWLVIAPGLAIAFLGAALALIGDGIDDRIKEG